MKKITVSEKFRDYIEGLLYEKNSRLNLILFMLQHDMHNKERFEKINQEYQEYFICYELAKRKLEEIYVYPEVSNFSGWNLDFKTCEVVVYEQKN